MPAERRIGGPSAEPAPVTHDGGDSEAHAEALMVLIGTDGNRLLAAAGIHAIANDPGALCLLAETLAHRDGCQLDGPAVRHRGWQWWQHYAGLLRERDPSVFTPPSGDPRTCLRVLTERVGRALGPGCGQTTAGLLAACLLQQAALAPGRHVPWEVR
jgi:hypothetical protein